MKAKHGLSFVGIGLFPLVIALAGCGGDADDPPGLIEQCSGVYRCGFPNGTESDGAMEKTARGCTFDGNILLTENGKVYMDGELTELTWSGDSAMFKVCGSGGCAECVERPSEGDGSAKSGRCTGSPVSCSSLGAGSCVLDGCSFDSRVTWNGSFENECTGSARACSNYTSEGSCERQTGCRWN